MDYYKTSVNPCSVESIAEGVELDSGARMWPLMVSCYQLEQDESRTGQMVLFLVNDSLRFVEPQIIQTDGSGILDGKWLNRGDEYWFATSRSTGQVRIDAFSFHQARQDEQFPVRHIATSEPLEGNPALCLSLGWDNHTCHVGDAQQQQQRIVSSFSDGTVVVHDVFQNESTFQLVERQSWLAHTLFGDTPVEVWSASFANNGEIVVTGGDDTKVKLWDLRSTMRPMQVLRHFEAGVTVVSSHPKRSHTFAVGSYDETIAIYDIRNASTPLSHSEPLGGGIWRIKWHPFKENRLLVAAMHGGCSVVDLEGDECEPRFHVTKKFTKHESMAYGADWLTNINYNNEFEAAVSCSFYDRAVYLWEAA